MALKTLELFNAGRLADAVASALADVRAAAADVDKRSTLCELLCFTGDLQRADAQLDAIPSNDPKIAVGVARFRHLIRAEKARQEFYTQGRLPEFLEQPNEEIKLRLEASIRLREKDFVQAASLIARANELRPASKGTLDGKPFSDLRDLDDLTAGVFEMLTPNGKFYWVTPAQIESIAFEPLKQPLDQLWRWAQVDFRGGTQGRVCLPTLYHPPREESDEKLKLGRATDWVQVDAAVLGIGQRTFLADETDHTILSVQTIEFDDASPAA